jgi:hypothetical protein
MTDEILDLTTHAAHQSDRWMFVALLVIGLISIGILFKYFTGRLDCLQSRMDRQTEDFVQHLKVANTEMLEIIHSAKEVISRVERKLDAMK